jgi:predicted solute-binding protein
MAVSLKLPKSENAHYFLNFRLHFDNPNDLSAGEIRDATRASSGTGIAAEN